MKSKKKLLLLGVGAMSAMALAVGATSTFAWFTANASVGKKQVADQESLTVTKTNTIVSGVKFVVSTGIDHDELVLTDTNGKTGYMNGGTPVGNIAIPDGQYGYADITATITVALQSPSGNAEADAAALQTAIGALAANDHVYVGAIPTSANSKLRLSTASGTVYAAGGVMATVYSEIAFTQSGNPLAWATEYTAHFYASIVGNTSALDTASNFSDLSVEVTCGSVESTTFTPYAAFE